MTLFFAIVIAAYAYPAIRNMRYRKGAKLADAKFAPDWKSWNGDSAYGALYGATFTHNSETISVRVKNYAVTLGNIRFNEKIYFKEGSAYCIKAGLTFYYPIVVSALGLVGILLSEIGLLK